MFNAGGDTSNALSIATHFPMIKLTHWFDYSKVHPCPRLLTSRQAVLIGRSNLERIMICCKSAHAILHSCHAAYIPCNPHSTSPWQT